MTLLHVKDLENGTFRLFCSSCFSPLDVVDGEYLQWATARSEGVFCFDCDMLGEDLPPVLLNAQPGDWLMFLNDTMGYADCHRMGDLGVFVEHVCLYLLPGEKLGSVVYRISQISNLCEQNEA